MPEPLTLTIDDAVRRRLVMDLWLHDVRALRGTRILMIAAAGGVVLLLWHNVAGALAVAGLLLLVRITWWWVRLTRSLARRLPTGQVVSIGHTATGDLVIRDTDEVWLPRGSATVVERVGSVTVVHGRAVSAIVPTLLLSDDDVAFLEGHAPVAAAHQPATDEVLDTPLSVEISERVQTDLTDARRRSYLVSGEFAIVPTLPLLLFGLMVFVAEPRTTLIATAVVSIPVVFALSVMRRSCAALARAYPVGHTLRARADLDGLVVTMVHGAVRMHWSDFEAHRLRERTVELRTRRGRPLANVTLPLDLFTPSSLELLTTAVPRSF